MNNDLKKLSHIDESGHANMVDIGDKDVSKRQALAKAVLTCQANTLMLIQKQLIKKGDVLTIAEFAGIMGAKKTHELIPLCHPLALSHVSLELSLDPSQNAILIAAKCAVNGKTGVEMEALTAVSIAALTLYDMLKAVDKEMVIGPIYLQEKTGGVSGDYIRKTPPSLLKP